MILLNNQTRVLLPKWLLEKENEPLFLIEVHKYLVRYPDYRFIQIEDGMALCERLGGVKNG
ncbi:hypothetical protein KHA94_09085 [Bacillus sp. FJAT-49705]|uniref:Uncharacterized protein n=1 Tax=Cytobacillus citreus TaxID=2833586 RepID=A0ABS5NTX9_9BACI|nr:hypothetical protein [Cytobacillus citreus]MBS4190354.1 hypothetical protein [Cytobacillus citreus]